MARSRGLVSTGMGAVSARLAYTDISRWAHDHWLARDPEELDDFVYIVQACDARWLELTETKKK